LPYLADQRGIFSRPLNIFLMVWRWALTSAFQARNKVRQAKNQAHHHDQQQHDHRIVGLPR
jgi:hypothetical protein